MNVNFPDRGGAVAASRSSFAAEIVPIAEVHGRGLRLAARDVADQAFARAALHDEDGAYPLADVVALAERGLLTATLPRELGGEEIGPIALSELLRQIGAGSLPLGRLFEGHVNASTLRFATATANKCGSSRSRSGPASSSGSGTPTTNRVYASSPITGGIGCKDGRSWPPAQATSSVHSSLRPMRRGAG
jgi:hypothetical protein